MANVFLSEEQKKKEEKKKKELKAKKKEEKKKKEEAKKAPIQFNEHLSFLNDIGKQQQAAQPTLSNGKFSLKSLGFLAFFLCRKWWGLCALKVWEFGQSVTADASSWGEFERDQG